jgi:hypothetical protein
MDARTKNG